MSWEKPQVIHKSIAELDQASQDQRNRVIDQYGQLLTDIENKIKAAQLALENINADIDGAHAKRLTDYEHKDNNLKESRKLLDDYANDLDIQGQELSKRNDKISSDIAKHNQAVDDHTALINKQKEDLFVLKQDLDHQQFKINEANKSLELLKNVLENERIEHADAQEEIRQSFVKLTADREALKASQAEYASQMDQYTRDMDNLNAQRHDLTTLQEALVKKELVVDGLKKEYEDGLKKNQDEITRLRDENIRIAILDADVNKRLHTSIEAEQKANTAIAKLEILKVDINKKIKLTEKPN